MGDSRYNPIGGSLLTRGLHPLVADEMNPGIMEKRTLSFARSHYDVSRQLNLYA